MAFTHITPQNTGYQRPVADLSSLDHIDYQITDVAPYKLVGDIEVINPYNKKVKCELAQERTKWAQFKDWFVHKFISNITSRDLSKYENAHMVVNAIRNDIKRFFPELDTQATNNLTDYVIARATNNKIGAITMDRAGKAVPKDYQLDIGYNEKYCRHAHALDSEEISIANRLLHDMRWAGLPMDTNVYSMDVEEVESIRTPSSKSSSRASLYRLDDEFRKIPVPQQNPNGIRPFSVYNEII